MAKSDPCNHTWCQRNLKPRCIEGYIQQENISKAIQWSVRPQLGRKYTSTSPQFPFEGIWYKLQLTTRWVDWVNISLRKLMFPLSMNTPTAVSLKVGLRGVDGCNHWIVNGLEDVLVFSSGWRHVADWDIQRCQLEPGGGMLTARGYLTVILELSAGPLRPTMVEASTETDVSGDGFGALSRSLQDYYLAGSEYDVTISVEGKTFRAHRSILSARSSVFAAMFSYNLSERTTGFVSITDCEPLTFEILLLYVYTGRIEDLNGDNVLGVYYAADKYDLSELKEVCIRFICSALTLDSICDIIVLATRHRDDLLFGKVTDYFFENMEEILHSCQWNQFMKENPTEANQVYHQILTNIVSKKVPSVEIE